jgi:hypothetical protein
MKNLKKRKATRRSADKRIVCESRSITTQMSPSTVDDRNMRKEEQIMKRQKIIEIQVANRKQISPAEEKKETKIVNKRERKDSKGDNSGE